MSKEKTVTNLQPSLSEVLASTCAELAKLSSNLGQALEQSGVGSRTDVALARLAEKDDDALVLLADVKLVSKKGVLVNISSENTLPGALDPIMLGTAHGSLAKMLEAALVAPILASFQNFATKLAKENKESKNMLSMMDGDDESLEGLFDDEDKD